MAIYMNTPPLVFVTEGLSVTTCGIYCLITWRSSTCLLIRIVYKRESLLIHRTQIEKQKNTDKLQNHKESVSVVYLYHIHCKNSSVLLSFTVSRIENGISLLDFLTLANNWRYSLTKSAIQINLASSKTWFFYGLCFML